MWGHGVSGTWKCAGGIESLLACWFEFFGLVSEGATERALSLLFTAVWVRLKKVKRSVGIASGCRIGSVRDAILYFIHSRLDLEAVERATFGRDWFLFEIRMKRLVSHL
jgi:hypothetical protein